MFITGKLIYVIISVHLDMNLSLKLFLKISESCKTILLDSKIRFFLRSRDKIEIFSSISPLLDIYFLK